MSKPALSQQIRALERDLGVTLFVRTSRTVELTAAGTALLAAAPRALYEVDRAIETAQKAATGEVGRLVIGSVRTGLGQVVPRVMRSFTTAHPHVRVEVTQMDTAQQLRALADGRIDVGIMRSASPTASLIVEPLISEPLMVALPHNHRLASEAVVDLAALADEPFVSWPRYLGEEFFDIVMALCREHGFSPKVNTEGDDIDSQLALVAAGFGVSLQPAFYASVAPVGITFLPLREPTPMVDLQIGRRRSATQLAQEFAAEALRMFDAA